MLSTDRFLVRLAVPAGQAEAELLFDFDDGEQSHAYADDQDPVEEGHGHGGEDALERRQIGNGELWAKVIILGLVATVPLAWILALRLRARYN